MLTKFKLHNFEMDSSDEAIIHVFTDPVHNTHPETHVATIVIGFDESGHGIEVMSFADLCHHHLASMTVHASDMLDAQFDSDEPYSEITVDL